MTQDEFLKKYHDYVADQKTATAEAIKCNEIGIEGDKALAVFFGLSLGWTLMLESAYIEVFGDDT